MRNCLRLLLAALLLTCVVDAASAQVCTDKAPSPQYVDPRDPVESAAETWLQKLNDVGGYTCAHEAPGILSQVKCYKNVNLFGSPYQVWYRFVYACPAGAACTITASDMYGWRNTATFSWDSTGQVWGFQWQGGYGWLVANCVPDLNHLNNPCILKWTTCEQ